MFQIEYEHFNSVNLKIIIINGFNAKNATSHALGLSFDLSCTLN